ncbi:MAG: anthranilate synthase component I family protein [Bacteroidetes bacterium]|nr:MAG: anthranilate synthase component I family protein [Bacteroidota bacterium]
MKTKIFTNTYQMLADTLTPVSIYLKMRDQFPNAILLESSDYKSSENSYSFIALKPLASFQVADFQITEDFFGQKTDLKVNDQHTVPDALKQFLQKFDVQNQENAKINGLFGYATYDSVQYFEQIRFKSPVKEGYQIPDMCYSFYQFVITINHFRNELLITENLLEGQESGILKVVDLLNSKNFTTYHFEPSAEETSNVSNDDFKALVRLGKDHCHQGNVFQIVLSRQFSRTFTGDDFNLYRALRSVNPSPYLYYFDFGNFKIFGSSPEAQIKVQNGKAYINPIAGTFRRTGDDQQDKELAVKLSADPKENSEHIMLVDLARNDLSRNSDNVVVETFKSVEYYSHVIHLVSKVSGILAKDVNTIQIMADSFPAGTLSGAPKFKAMQIIDDYENQRRGYYGGCLGYLGFNGEINQAIMIRSFLSKNNTLFYQAGAGIVADSTEEGELNEVNNKLAALQKAILLAKNI